MTEAETAQIRKDFNALDLNKDGRIDRKEMLEAYQKVHGLARANNEVDAIMNKCDTYESGYIEYGEFLAAEMDKKKALNKTNLKVAFEKFDSDGNGSISSEEIRALLGGD